MHVAVLRTTALALVALGGCYVPEPNNREAERPAWAVEAIEGVEIEWSERVAPMVMPLVRWFEPADGCLIYDDSAYAGRCLHGMTWLSPSGDEIHVLTTDTPRESALAHEGLHYALETLDGDSDVDHHRPGWAQVGEVEGRL